MLFRVVDLRDVIQDGRPEVCYLERQFLEMLFRVVGLRDDI